MYHCIKAVPFLLTKGADPLTTDQNDRTLFHQIAKRPLNHFDTFIQKLIDARIGINQQDRNGQTPLMITIYGSEGHSSIVQKFLQIGADPNIQDISGNTLLHYLAEKHRMPDVLQFAQILIENGTHVDLKNNAGQTPLMIAIQHGQITFAEMLIKEGADINVRDKRGEPLIVKVISCNADKISLLKRLLKQSSIEVDAHSQYGSNALAKAIHSNTTCLDPARLQLEASADPNFRDQNGYTSLHKLIYRKHDDRHNAVQ